MSARDQLFALAKERGLTCGSHRLPSGTWSASAWSDASPTMQTSGPTEDAACAALLLKLEPPALPRLGKTPREEARVMLGWALAAVRRHVQEGETLTGTGPLLWTLAEASAVQQIAWLEAFAAEPPRTLHPTAVALVEAMALRIGEERASAWEMSTEWSGPDDRAFAAWLAAGRPVWTP